MKLPEFSVNRKVTASMLAMILVVLGLITFTRLGLDFFPDIEFPTVSVITSYRGASSEDIENTITKTLEQVINSVSGVKKVNSITSEGVSVINVEFEWGTNLDFAAQDVRDQLGLYKSYLPEEATDPLVVKFSLSQIPIIFYGITAEKMPLYELKELVEDEVASRLERIDGVASAQVYSMSIREILVDLDKSALESMSISLDQILLALRMENLNLPAGRIVERHSEFLLRTLGEFKTLDDIRNTIIGSTQSGQAVYLKDVAEVRDTMKEARYLGRIQGQKGVFLIINKRSGANTVITGQAVKKELQKIKEVIPSDVEFFTAMDQAKMIQMVIRKTANNALIGGILAIFFIFIFLRNWRPTITIALSIPLSIITTFIAFYLAGYTLNMLTLGGLALGIGMLVDNAIVVIENTFRHIEEGKERNKAAKIGASEVGMAITASTLTTIAVFFPMVFARGITGKLTRGLALAIAFSLLASLFVALTVVPLVASLLFKENNKRGLEVKGRLSVGFDKARNFYRKILHRALQRRWWVLGGTFGLLLVSLVIVFFLGTEFMPSMDRSMIMLSVKMPVGTALDETNRVVAMVENLMTQEPSVEIVTAQVGSQAEDNPADVAGGFSATGTHEGLLWVGLVDRDKRKLSADEIMERIRKKLPQLKDVKFEALDLSQTMTGGAQAPVEIKIFGKELELLKETANNIVDRIRDVEGLRDVTHSLAEGKPEYHINVNREQASRMGLMVSQVASTIQTAALGKVATRFREGNEEIDIRVRFKEKFRDSLDSIGNIPIMTPLKTMVRLDQVASISKGEGPIRINRENQARVVTVTANIAGRDLGSVVKDINKRINGVEKGLPSGYFIEFGGQYEQMKDAFIIMAGAFALAILLVYMIMASQFESFIHPFVIMFTIPFAVIGVVLALLVTGRPIGLPVLIGVVILAGIAVNNGIVMIDYVNQLKRRGLEKKEAILQGSVTRLRPVLITALTTIAGMMPMALSTSEGGEMRAPMAITVIGGLTATTFLTLFVIPIIYSLVDRVKFAREKDRDTSYL
jgi:HAE1 family hydrophobic/amphiphilic exporter-1